MVEQMDELVQVIVQDTGKVPVDALVADVMPTLESIEYVRKHAEKILAPKKVKTPLLLIGKSHTSSICHGTLLFLPGIIPCNYQ